MSPALDRKLQISTVCARNFPALMQYVTRVGNFLVFCRKTFLYFCRKHVSCTLHVKQNNLLKISAQSHLVGNFPALLQEPCF